MPRGLRDEEEWVRQFVEAAIPGSTVVQHDDGSSPGMHDLTMLVAGRCQAAIEVSAAIDPVATELSRLISRSASRTQPSLTGGWRVTVEKTARARDLRVHLLPLLRALESQNRQHLPALDRRSYTTEDEFAESLGIRSARRHDTDGTGSLSIVVGFTPEQSGGGAPENADALTEWIEEWMAADHQRDNVSKLARASAPERHMVVLVGPYTTAPFEVIHALAFDGASAPTKPPTLPEPITHCWVASTWNSDTGFRWDHDHGWTTFSKLQTRLVAHRRRGH